MGMRRPDQSNDSPVEPNETSANKVIAIRRNDSKLYIESSDGSDAQTDRRLIGISTTRRQVSALGRASLHVETPTVDAVRPHVNRVRS